MINIRIKICQIVWQKHWMLQWQQSSLNDINIRAMMINSKEEMEKVAIMTVWK